MHSTMVVTMTANLEGNRKTSGGRYVPVFNSVYLPMSLLLAGATELTCESPQVHAARLGSIVSY